MFLSFISAMLLFSSPVKPLIFKPEAAPPVQNAIPQMELASDSLDWRGTYIGDLGGKAVVVQIGQDHYPYARFFMRDSGQDRFLIGVSEDAALFLWETSEEFAEFGPEVLKKQTKLWQLRQVNGQVSGELTGAVSDLKSNAVLELNLRPVRSSDLKSQLSAAILERWKTEQKYTFLKFNRPLLAGVWTAGSNKKDKLEPQNIKVGNLTFQYLSEASSKLSYPHVAGSKTLEPVLTSRQLEWAERSLANCRAGALSLKVTPTWADGKMISLHEQSQNACDGSAQNDSLNLLPSGKKAILEDVVGLELPPKWTWKTFELELRQSESLSGSLDLETYAILKEKAIRALALKLLPKLKTSSCWGTDEDWTGFGSSWSWYLERSSGKNNLVLFKKEGFSACLKEEIRLPLELLPKPGSKAAPVVPPLEPPKAPPPKADV
jgi:hypothetical protein